jgi:uncharacterized membrane protein YvlD (DUF360 family)
VLKPAILLRAAVLVVLDAALLLLLAWIFPGLTFDSGAAALATAAGVGLLNSFIWPALARFALPLSVLTLGLGALALNGLLVALVIDAVPGAEIHGWGTGVGVTLGLAAFTAILSALLAIDEDESWYRNVVRRQARRRGDHVESDVPGVIFLEIDGLAHDVIRRAVRDGNAPTIARWLREGSHHLAEWETDWSSQTGACQAGLLHGDNHDMPAFRWWEKDRGKPIVTNHPKDAAELERRHSNGSGLLHEDGASRANILSGDAVHSSLTMSTVLTRRRPIGRDYSAYFAGPYAVARTLVGIVAEYARERHAQARQRRRDVQPRIARPRVYALMRAFATVIQLDLQVAAVVGDMLAGRPVVYTTFLAYDEVAHHSGIERPDTLATLAKVDRQIARVEATRKQAPRPYRLVVLSDHGQSQGATFLQRYGVTLEDLVRSLVEPAEMHVETGGEDDASAYLGAGLAELARDETMTARAAASAGRRLEKAEAEPEDDALPELSVMASGNLGLISFPREPGRVTMERLDELYPRLLPELRSHPGIAFAMVRSDARGTLALGPSGVRVLDTGEVEGDDPLAGFGANAADHLRRTDAFPHCPDVLVNSRYWEETGEVAAFEELVGSHGGMGGTQSHPFVLHPADLPWPGRPVIGAESVHQIFRRWLVSLGHVAYATSVDSPGERIRTSTPGASSAT